MLVVLEHLVSCTSECFLCSHHICFNSGQTYTVSSHDEVTQDHRWEPVVQAISSVKLLV